jgi:hypothetical protein
MKPLTTSYPTRQPESTGTPRLDGEFQAISAALILLCYSHAMA